MEAHDAMPERLVPHRGGMLWIDRVIHCDADAVVAEASIRADHLLAEWPQASAWSWLADEYRVLQRAGVSQPDLEHLP